MDERYETLMGRGPRQITHWEHWSNPDAETYLTGIDDYDHPRECRLRLVELYPQLKRMSVPDTDKPIPRLRLEQSRQSADHETHTVRWGPGKRIPLSPVRKSVESHSETEHAAQRQGKRAGRDIVAQGRGMDRMCAVVAFCVLPIEA